MKTTKLILLVSVCVSLNACKTDLEDIITADDITALKAMETSYFASANYNDSLVSYIVRTAINNDETCFYYDSRFHHYDSMFNANHMIYSHKNRGDDHDGDSWTMGSGYMNGNGGMIGNGAQMMNRYNSGFCTLDNPNLMDSLMQAHSHYHPGN